MRSFKFASLILGLMLLQPCWAAAEKASELPPVAQNVALQYWQAFAQMPTLDKDQEKLLEQWNSVPLDAAAQKLIASSYSSLMYLHRGAKIEHCDWGLDYNDGAGLMLPHLSKSRDLARLAALRARSDFERGNWKGARADATAMMGLARHVGRDPIMIGLLVQFLIEETTVELVAPYVPQIKAPYSKAVSMFDSLPNAATLPETIRAEKKFMGEWMIRKLKEEEQRKAGSGLELWKKLIDGSGKNQELPQFNQIDEVVELGEKLLPIYDELAELAELPDSKFEAQYPDFKQKAKAANPIAGLILPAIDQIRAKQQRNEARMRMLLAASPWPRGDPRNLGISKTRLGPDHSNTVRSKMASNSSRNCSSTISRLL